MNKYFYNYGDIWGNDGLKINLNLISSIATYRFLHIPNEIEPNNISQCNKDTRNDHNINGVISYKNNNPDNYSYESNIVTSQRPNTVGSNDKHEIQANNFELIKSSETPIDSSTPMRMAFNYKLFYEKNGDSNQYPAEDIKITKINGAMGLSIVGGGSVPCHPFGIDEPGIFISKIAHDGAASRTNLKIGDRILKVNGIDVTKASHDETVEELKRYPNEVVLTVRHDPQPLGLNEITLSKLHPEETIGIRIHGGIENKSANPFDQRDEGIFIIDVNNFYF